MYRILTRIKDTKSLGELKMVVNEILNDNDNKLIRSVVKNTACNKAIKEGWTNVPLFFKKIK